MDTAAAGFAFAFAVDAATAAAGAFNTALLLTRHAGGATVARRYAVVSLALLNAGAAVQALCAQALYAAHRAGADIAPFFETGPWFASRAPLLTGTLLVAWLLVRRSSR
jgi:hypothetical protein